MSSRNYPKVTISDTPPQNSVVGDEYFSPANSILYKKVVTSTGPTWFPVNAANANPSVSTLKAIGSTIGDGGTNTGLNSLVYIQQNTTWTGAQPWALYVSGYTYLGGFRVNGADGQRSLYLGNGQLGFATGDGLSPITFTTGSGGQLTRMSIDGVDGNVRIYSNVICSSSFTANNGLYSGSLYITGTGNGITFTDGTLQTTAGSSVANTLYLTGGLNAANANIAYIQNNLNTANANIAYILAIQLSQNTNITVAGTTANNALPNTGTIISTNGISSLLITNTSTSTSSTTGALQVKGGVGISGNTYAGGIVFANNGLYAGNTFTPALGTYNDGIVVDYVQGTVGNGRISVGTNDVITFYTGGVGTAPVANIFGNSTISTANVFTNNLYAASGIGYPVVGSTGVVTQGTNRTTGVTLNRPSGQIVLFSQAMGVGTANTFVLTNSSISANDFLMLTQWSGSATGSIGNYVLSANTSAGQANVTIRANATIAADVPVLQFVVIKASAT